MENKLKAKFVVATTPQEFEFDSAEKAQSFMRALAKSSARSARKHSGQSGVGAFPAQGSLLNAYPIKEDGTTSEDGLTLAEQPSEINFVAKKKRQAKTTRGKKTEEADNAPTED